MKYILITILLFMSSCVSTLDNKEQLKEINTANRIRLGIRDTLINQNFFLISTGGSSSPSINLVSEGFATKSYRFKSIKEARVLICKIMEMYLTAYNEKTSIRPYLSNFPFEAKNFQISLIFLNDNSEYLEEPYVTGINCREGLITYISRDGYGENKMIAQETFDAANSIYKQTIGTR